MEKSKNHKMLNDSNLREAIYINNLRHSGNRKDIVFDNELLINKKIDDEYAICFTKKSSEIIESLPAEEDLKKNFDATFGPLKVSGIEMTADLFYFFEILLRSLNYTLSIGNRINKRLNFFCFKNLIFLNQTSIEISDKEIYKNELLKNLLFFNPCSESYIEKFAYGENKLSYNGQKTDVIKLFENFSENIIADKKAFSSLSTINQTEIKLAYSLIFEILNNIFGEVRQFKNSTESFLYSFFRRDKIHFYERIIDGLKYYIVTSWENETDGVSLFYGREKSENVLNRNVKAFSKLKYKSEYLIDFYIYYFARKPNELLDILEFMRSKNNTNDFNKFLLIIFSHPFVTYSFETKKSYIKSGLIEILPDGFAKNKLTKFKELNSL